MSVSAPALISIAHPITPSLADVLLRDPRHVLVLVSHHQIWRAGKGAEIHATLGRVRFPNGIAPEVDDYVAILLELEHCVARRKVAALTSRTLPLDTARAVVDTEVSIKSHGDSDAIVEREEGSV